MQTQEKPSADSTGRRRAESPVPWMTVPTMYVGLLQLQTAPPACVRAPRGRGHLPRTCWTSSRGPEPGLATVAKAGGEMSVQHTFWTSLCSAAASTTAATYSPKPRVSKALVMWSQPIVFLASLSEISFASDEMRVMNSTQHSINRSLASLENAIPVDAGKISLTIFWTVAAGELTAVVEASEIFKRGLGLPYPWARTDRRWL